MVRPSSRGRRAGLQPAHREVQFAQPRAEPLGRRVAGPAGFVVLKADMDEAGQEGAGGQDDRVRMEHQTDLRHDAGDPVTLDEQIVDGLLEQREVGLVLEPVADGALVQHPIRLGPRRAHRRPLAGVENAELDARLVRGQRHRPAQRIHFLDQVPLADPADRRVAGHLAQRLDVVREQQRGAAHPGRRQRCLGAGMAATHDDDIEALIELHDFQGLFVRPANDWPSVHFSPFTVVPI